MDLQTIENKIRNNKYNDDEEFNDDINLVWKNALIFNEEGSQIYEVAK